MSLEVMVDIQVGEGDVRYVSIGRTESVQLPAHPDDMGDTGVLDLVDLLEAVLQRLVDETRTDAIRQIAQIKDIQKR